MSVFEDETDRFLKQIRRARKAVEEHILRGNVSLDNVIGGYMHERGQLNGLDEAERLFKEVFRNWLQNYEVDPAWVDKQEKDDTY